jgi:hypothetical protein
MDNAKMVLESVNVWMRVNQTVVTMNAVLADVGLILIGRLAGVMDMGEIVKESTEVLLISIVIMRNKLMITKQRGLQSGVKTVVLAGKKLLDTPHHIVP